MPYFLINDFRGGIDLRKSVLSSPAGTARVIKNAYVNAGGEVEKRKAFVKIATVPNDTYGLSALNNDLFVFGAGTNPIAGGEIDLTPTGVLGAIKYHKVAAPTTDTMVGVLDTELFEGKWYVVVLGASNTPWHSWNGTTVVNSQSGTPLKGVSAKTYRDKVYSADADVIYFSAILDPGSHTGVGAGFINASSRDGSMVNIIGIEQYYDQLAFFSSNSVQLWRMDADPAQNAEVQVLGGSGTMGTRSVSRYSSGDVIYLSRSGIRSLRARDSSTFAAVTDVGSAIDTLITEALKSFTPADTFKIYALIEPLLGQYWLAWGNRIYVLSAFSSSKVLGWSYYETPAAIDHITSVGNAVAFRAGNDIYLYGGQNLEEYDASEVVIETPMLDFDRMADHKAFVGFDLLAENTWAVDVRMDPTRPHIYERLAVFSEATPGMESIPMTGVSSHIGLKFTCVADGPAKLAQAAIHFQTTGAS